MITTTADVHRYADEIMTAIDDDIAGGAVPQTVASFVELHDYVDANTYTIDADIPYDLMTDGGMDLVHEVETEVTRRLAGRAPLGEYMPVQWSDAGSDATRYGWVTTPLDDRLRVVVTDAYDTATRISLHVSSVRAKGLHPSGKTHIVVNPNGVPREECEHGLSAYDGCEDCDIEPMGE